MQTQLTHLATISQQRFVSNERDIPLFEEAFDTASLRKFFQRQDSTSNTPLTLCSDSPVLDHFQLFEQDTKSIFSSPIKTTTEGCPAVYCLPNFTLQAELDEGLCTTINGFMEKKFDGFENQDSMDDVVDQFSEEDAETGSLSMDNDAKAGIVDEETSFTVNITGSFFAQRAILDDEQMIEEDSELLNEERSDNYVKVSNWDFESKLKSKTVFIIERNVARHVIEKKPKKEKKEKKLQSLEKKKKLKKAEKAEKAESDKETNKENEAPVAVEKVKRKYTKHKKLAKEGQEAAEGMDVELKKKKKADKEEKIKMKIKKIKDTDEKKAIKKEKAKAKAEKSSVKND